MYENIKRTYCKAIGFAFGTGLIKRFSVAQSLRVEFLSFPVFGFQTFCAWFAGRLEGA